LVQVEKVAYRPTAPWPTTASGTGQSLQRATLLAYANDPVNWFAVAPTAGTLSPQTSQDVDGDGMSDVWEMANGTDPFIADGDADPDGDGFSNYREWLAGTDPQDPTSYLKFTAILSGANQVTLQFTAMANRTYSVLEASSLNAPVWFKVADVPAAPTNRVFFLDQPTSAIRFFRITAPAQP
jgi:hypothetical protein